MSMTVDVSGLENMTRILQQFTDKKARSAVNSALNRSLTAMSTRASKSLRQTYNIKSADIKGHLEKKSSTVGRLVAELRGSGSPISIIKFKAAERRPKGVFVTIKKRAKKRLPHSFFVGAKGSFHRKRVSRLPIEKEYGPSLPGMLKNQGISEEVLNRGLEIYEKRIQHEFDRMIGGSK